MDVEKLPRLTAPNFGNVNGPLVLEQGRFTAAQQQALREAGHELREVPLTSGLQVLRRVRNGGVTQWQGGTDPRREGQVLGE